MASSVDVIRHGWEELNLVVLGGNLGEKSESLFLLEIAHSSYLNS